MKTMEFGRAADQALAQAMAEDQKIIVFGEDVHMLRHPLLIRFGEKRVRAAPISEAAFVGAAVAAGGGAPPAAGTAVGAAVGAAGACCGGCDEHAANRGPAMLAAATFRKTLRENARLPMTSRFTSLLLRCDSDWLSHGLPRV